MYLQIDRPVPENEWAYIYDTDPKYDQWIKDIRQGKPVLSEIKEPIIFQLYAESKSKKLGSVLPNASQIYIAKKFIGEAFAEAGAPMELIPVTLLSNKGKTISNDYVIINPLCIYDCVNMEQSEMYYEGWYTLMVKSTIVTPTKYLKEVMSICEGTAKGKLHEKKDIGSEKIELHYDLLHKEVKKWFKGSLDATTNKEATFHYEEPDYSNSKIVSIKKLVLSSEKLNNAPAVFRMTQEPHQIMYHHSIYDKLLYQSPFRTQFKAEIYPVDVKDENEYKPEIIDKSKVKLDIEIFTEDDNTDSSEVEKVTSDNFWEIEGFAINKAFTAEELGKLLHLNLTFVEKTTYGVAMERDFNEGDFYFMTLANSTFIFMGMDVCEIDGGGTPDIDDISKTHQCKVLRFAVLDHCDLFGFELFDNGKEIRSYYMIPALMDGEPAMKVGKKLPEEKAKSDAEKAVNLINSVIGTDILGVALDTEVTMYKAE